MKNILFLLASAYTILLTSCECSKVDCRVAEYKQFLLLSKVDSSDLILSGQFVLDSLSISTILADTTKSGSAVSIESYQNPFGYSAYVESNLNTIGYIIRLDSLPPDTLFVKTGISEGSKCCSGFIRFELLLLNGDTLANSFSDQYIEIYK